MDTEGDDSLLRAIATNRIAPLMKYDDPAKREAAAGMVVDAMISVAITAGASAGDALARIISGEVTINGDNIYVN